MSSSGSSVYGEEMSCQKCRGIVLKVLSFSPILATGSERVYIVEWSRKTKDNFQQNGTRERVRLFAFFPFGLFGSLVCGRVQRGKIANCHPQSEPNQKPNLPCIDPVRWCSETRVNIIRNVGCLIAAFYMACRAFYYQSFYCFEQQLSAMVAAGFGQ